jgi:hypothetical protein
VRPNVPQNTEPPTSKPANSEPRQAPRGPSANPPNRVTAVPRPHPKGGGATTFNRRRAVFVLSQIDEILAWQHEVERELETRGIELGRYLCEVREHQYYRVDKMRSFGEFLKKKFPQSRRMAYYLMAVYEKLPREIHRDVKRIGWTKARELVRIARREGRKLNRAPWVHKAASMTREQFKREVERHLTGRDPEPREMIYFSVYKRQLPVIEQALEAASAVLGGRKSRGTLLEFICADFVANAGKELSPGALSDLIRRFFVLLPTAERRELLNVLAKCV